MLWVTQQETDIESLDEFKKKYGFINEQGERITPAKYIFFGYTLDEQNRYQYLSGYTGDQVDIFTMDGRKLLELPAESIQLFTQLGLIHASLVEGTYYGVGIDPDSRETLYDLYTGERLLQNDYLGVCVVNQNFVVAIDLEEQEYLIDLRKGEDNRVPLEGHTYENHRYDSGFSEEEFLLVGATYLSDHEPQEEIRYGYMGVDGKWIIEPVYSYATSFLGDYAGVEGEDGLNYFIDRQGNAVGTEKYVNIYNTGDRFVVVDKEFERHYLDQNLEPLEIAQVKVVKDQLYYGEEFICQVPTRCSEIAYNSFPVVIVSPTAEWSGNSYFVNIETGERHHLPGSYWKVYNIGDFYVGIINYSEREFQVFEKDGTLLTDTVFHRYPSAIDYLTDGMYQSDCDYLWVTTARYQGYIDVTGKWLYRESRFGYLAD